MYGVAGDPFHVHASYCSSQGLWAVSTLSTRVGQTNTSQRKIDWLDQFVGTRMRCCQSLTNISTLSLKCQTIDNNETFSADLFQEGNPDDEDDDANDDDGIPLGLVPRNLLLLMSSHQSSQGGWSHWSKEF